MFKILSVWNWGSLWKEALWSLTPSSAAAWGGLCIAPPPVRSLLNSILWRTGVMRFQVQDLQGTDLLLQALIHLSKDPLKG